ncbi:DUF1800 family protein [Paraburkholderia silvatlantica]|uniref:DUF1800 family protein n=1 Tax=Paraburkholderia silvatlantica TaxID=321895 RepID=UPI0010E4D183|nr:DUF1800 family protein [Paraburkholderia silvatlantica]TDQ77770.1 uncharacterized protein DUF1800 [Paraburkholderia silvatlantica]
MHGQHSFRRSRHSGPFDGDQVLDILLAQPQTARYGAERLWRECICATPDDVQLASVADRFRASGYEVGAALFVTPAFRDERNRSVPVSSPVEFIVGAMRRFDVAYGDTLPFARRPAALGEPLFYPPNVKACGPYLQALLMDPVYQSK